MYRSAWRGFEAWCRSLGREPLGGDPELIAMYATHRADRKVAVSALRIDPFRIASQLRSDRTLACHNAMRKHWLSGSFGPVKSKVPRTRIAAAERGM